MIDPNAQGELLLSFLVERTQQGHSAGHATTQTPTYKQRVFASIGSLLIRAGTDIQRRALPEYQGYPVGIVLEVK